MPFSSKAIYGRTSWFLGRLWNLYGAGMFFQKFLNKPMQRERDSGGLKYFLKTFIPLPPLKVSWIPLSMQFLHHRWSRDSHTPTRTKDTVPWEWKWGLIKMSEGMPKSAPVAMPWPHHWRMPEFIQSQSKTINHNCQWMVNVYQIVWLNGKWYVSQFKETCLFKIIYPFST